MEGLTEVKFKYEKGEKTKGCGKAGQPNLGWESQEAGI